MKANQLKPFLIDVLQSNETLIKNNKIPIAVKIEGVHGIGKTQIVLELAKETNYFVKKLNLAQFELVGDLTGYSVKEFEMCKDNKCVWITENQIPHYITLGWDFTNKTQTKQCPPEWIVDLPERTILYLDDLSRANSLIIQAVMELLDKREFTGWNLPKFCQVVLSTNPDNGEYNVSSLDGAQLTRSLNVSLEWDVQSWSEWSEQNKRDERSINFVNLFPELFEQKKQDGLVAVNNITPRVMDKFFDITETIEDFNSKLEYISHLAYSTVGETFLNLFLKFIHQKLDKLPSIKKIIHEYDLSTGKSELTKACGNYTEVNYKHATAATLSNRIAVYCLFNKLSKQEIEKLAELICHTSFTEDMKYTIMHRIAQNATLFTALMHNVKLIKYVSN